MKDILNVILVFYCVLLCSNAGISFYLWWKTKEELFKLTLPIWGFSFLNFFLQGIFQQPGLLMLLSFGSYLLVSMSFYYFARTMKEQKVSFTNNSFFLSYVMVVLSIISWEISQSFIVSSTLMSIAVVIPMLDTVVFLLKNQTLFKIESKVFALLLSLNTLHFLDYPILRFSEQGAILGYSIAVFLLFLLSVFIPMYIVQKNGSKYSMLLEHEVNRQTKELRDLSNYNNALLNIVSHDISSPMMVLELAIDMFFKKDITQLNQTAMDHAKKKVRTALASLEDTLNKVRTLQSARSGKLGVNLANVCMAEIEDELKILFEDKLKAKKLELVIERKDEICLLVDKGIFKNQVLANLLSNAVKFSPEGSTIIMRSEDSLENGYLSIFIQDQGIGIPKEILRNLFSFEVKTTRLGTHNEKGTGFGLPLVKTCLEMMNGEIEVISRTVQENLDGLSKEQGTTFKIKIKKAS